MMPMWKPAALALAPTLAAATARAQISTGATPVYHGTLRILRPGVGTFDTATGIGTLRVRRWQLELNQDSNGIFPDQEPAVVALGDESFRLDAGSLKRSRNGKVFRYRVRPEAGQRGIRSFRIARRASGIYVLSFTLIGVDLSQLVLENPVPAPGRHRGRRRRLHGRRPDDPAGVLAPPRRPARLPREHLAVGPELMAA